MHCDKYTQEPSCIQRVPIFSHLDMNRIKDFEAITRSLQFKKGDFIFREGDRSETLFVINEGIIKISKVSNTGKEHIVRFLFPGDFFGQFALFQEETHYANAEALEDVVICIIHKRDFIVLLEKNPQVTYRFLMELTNKLRQTDEWISDISLLEVDRRLAKLLLVFYKQHSTINQTFELPVAKKELAALIGTTPETVSRKLSQFESLGFIRLIGRVKLLITDANGLEQYVGAEFLK